MSNTYFVTGTDTGVGKTVVSAALLNKAATQGLSAYGLKPIAAGCFEQAGQWVNDDALLLQAHSSVKLPYQQVNPIALKAAVAPHIAALKEGKRLSLARLEGLVKGALMQKADLKIVEGAGGWRVPLAPNEFLSGLPLALNMPVILVVGLRLGCLNHALLTAEAIQRDGLVLAGWVGNVIDDDTEELDLIIQTLDACLPCPRLGKIEKLSPLSIATVASQLSIPA